jgi:hypothetical protein
MATDPQTIAKWFGAKYVGEVHAVASGPLGMVQLAHILHQRLTPSQGQRPGRPTDASWDNRAKVPAARVDAASRVSDNYRVKRFSANTRMTMPQRLNDTERERADGEAVLRRAFHGEPLVPEVARRGRARGAESTEEICREHDK